MAKSRWLPIMTWLQVLKENALLLYFAWKHPQTPRSTKNLLTALAVYVISPVDLAPDIIPLIGLVDDVTLFSAAVFYLTAALPPEVNADCRRQSRLWTRRLPWLLAAVLLLLVAWTALIVVGLYRLFTS